jgi:hypothetical protein
MTGCCCYSSSEASVNTSSNLQCVQGFSSRISMWVLRGIILSMHNDSPGLWLFVLCLVLDLPHFDHKFEKQLLGCRRLARPGPESRYFPIWGLNDASVRSPCPLLDHVQCHCALCAYTGLPFRNSQWSISVGLFSRQVSNKLLFSPRQYPRENLDTILWTPLQQLT